MVRSPYMSLIHCKSKTKKRVDVNVLKFLLSKILDRFAITARPLLAQFYNFLNVYQNQNLCRPLKLGFSIALMRKSQSRIGGRKHHLLFSQSRKHLYPLG